MTFQTGFGMQIYTNVKRSVYSMSYTCNGKLFEEMEGLTLKMLIKVILTSLVLVNTTVPRYPDLNFRKIPEIFWSWI